MPPEAKHETYQVKLHSPPSWMLRACTPLLPKVWPEEGVATRESLRRAAGTAGQHTQAARYIENALSLRGDVRPWVTEIDEQKRARRKKHPKSDPIR